MVQYRVDSHLIIVRGALSEGEEVGAHYFRLTEKNSYNCHKAIVALTGVSDCDQNNVSFMI